MQNRIKIIFFGTPAFSIPILDALFSSGFEIACVVTSPDSPVGRKKILTSSPVKKWAEVKDLKVLSPVKLKEISADLKELKPDLGVIAFYGKIIPGELLAIPRKGFINIHPSLLPRWRGPSPLQSAIMAGDEKTGVTIHITRDKVDAGEILAQNEVNMKPGENYPELIQKLSKFSAELILSVIPAYLENKIVPREQNETEATYSKIIKTEDGHINWAKSVEEILRQIRALNPEPGTFTFLPSGEASWNGKRLLILSAKAKHVEHSVFNMFGEVVADNDGFKITASDGFVEPLKIKLEGKKEITPKEFLRGYPSIIGATLS
jgi:methionyl-tRNA formyltransferase